MHSGYNNNFPGHPNQGYGGPPPYFQPYGHGHAPQGYNPSYPMQQPPGPNMPPQAVPGGGGPPPNTPYGAPIKSVPSGSSDKKSNVTSRPATSKVISEGPDAKKTSVPVISTPSYRAPPSLHTPTKEEEEEQDFYSVSPMRSDFHFFAADHKEEYLEAAKATAKEQTKSDKPSAQAILTALNERVMKMWEDQSPSSRSSYLTREEEDRRRFMQEDEIAGRHCATLTARSKSPRVPIGSGKVAKVVTKDEDDVMESNVAKDVAPSNKRDASDSEDKVDESPLKKSKLDIKLASDSQETSTDALPSHPETSAQPAQDSQSDTSMKVEEPVEPKVPEVSPEKKPDKSKSSKDDQVDGSGKTVSESECSDTNIIASKAV
jgi:hypothetical protein